MIKYTNNKNYPDYVCEWLKGDDYDYDPSPDCFSATSLLRPARMYALQEKHRGELVIDVDDLIAVQMGNALHGRMEQIKLPKVQMIEKRFKAEINGNILSGKPDMVFDNTIVDMKTTSVWGFVYKESDDYVRQMSIYRWILERNGVKVNSWGTIWYIFTDWKRSEGRFNPDYPDSRIKCVDYELMNEVSTEAFIIENINRLKSARIELPECTDEELWRTADKWEGAKRAKKVYSEESEANEALISGYEIEYRPGRVKRCNYCNVCNFCEQYKELTKQGLIEV